MRLPVHPSGAYFVAMLADPVEPIDFTTYFQTVDRTPMTTIEEYCTADATMMAIIIDREQRLTRLRLRWIFSVVEIGRPALAAHYR